MEDPLRLREELAQLKKEIAQAQHVKEAVNSHNEALLKEELGYIAAIPEFKRQAKIAESETVELNKQTNIARGKLKVALQELEDIRILINQESISLRDAKTAHDNIYKDCESKKADVLNRVDNVVGREKAIAEREKNFSNREAFNKKVDMDLDKRQAEIENREKEHAQASDELNFDIESHQSNVEQHGKNLALFAEQKRFHLQDEQTLKDKLARADKLMQDNAEIKSGLLLQSNKLSNQLLICDQKQRSLDKNIADLRNQENNLRIKELRVAKIIKDKNLQEELKALEESLK